MQDDKVKNKVVLVTGANRGIGKAIVEGFVQNGAAKVYAVVRRLESAEPLVQAHPGKVVPVYMDLSKPETIEKAALETKDVTIVVNNAGVLMGNSTPLEAAAVENLQYELQVNVFGLLHVARVYAPLLKENGVFCQINSVGSFRCAAPNVATYSCTKAASYSLTQSIRTAMPNCQVISVHPGPIETDMIPQANLGNPAEPPEQVAEAIIEAIQTGAFHVYPDSKSKALGRVYHEFATKVVEPGIPYPK